MKWMGDVHFIFFIEALILMIGLFSFIRNFEGKISVSLAFLVFFAFYYNESLNISRQYIAVGIGFFAAKYLMNNRWKTYLVCCIIAMMFHSSGIILIVGYLVWLFLFNTKKKSIVTRRIILLFLGMILACILIRPLVNLLSNWGVIPAKYIQFLKASDASSSVWKTIISNCPLLIMLFYLRNKLYAYDERNKVAITFYLLGFIITMINTVYGNVGRLAVSWTSWQIILYPECCKLIMAEQKNTKTQMITKILFVMLFLIHWYYCVIYRNFGDTLPYHSDMFTWLNW